MGIKTKSPALTEKNLSSTNGATVTLVAEWTRHTYTFKVVAVTDGAESTTGGNAYVSESGEVSVMNDVAFEANIYARAVAKAGYHFVGWYTTLSGGKLFLANCRSTLDVRIMKSFSASFSSKIVSAPKLIEPFVILKFIFFSLLFLKNSKSLYNIFSSK